MSTTCPERGAGGRATHTGFSMVSVVFILVVLAALGAALASVSRQQHLAAAAELQSARAYQAARAGLEWWAYWQRNVGATTGACLPVNSLVPGGNLAGFTVTLTCTLRQGTDGGTALTYWTAVANACNAPSNGACPASGAVDATYVERQLTWTLVQ
jgi:MSHA biogenesis protein MshP